MVGPGRLDKRRSGDRPRDHMVTTRFTLVTLPSTRSGDHGQCTSVVMAGVAGDRRSGGARVALWRLLVSDEGSGRPIQRAWSVCRGDGTSSEMPSRCCSQHWFANSPLRQSGDRHPQEHSAAVPLDASPGVRALNPSSRCTPSKSRGCWVTILRTIGEPSAEALTMLAKCLAPTVSA